MTMRNHANPPRFGAQVNLGGHPTQPSGFLRLPDVMKRVGLSKSTIYLWMKQGRFPLSIKLGDVIARWNEYEIDEWICAQIEKARDKAA